MRAYTPHNMRDVRHKEHANMSFDEILDLTAVRSAVYLNFSINMYDVKHSRAAWKSQHTAVQQRDCTPRAVAFYDSYGGGFV